MAFRSSNQPYVLVAEKELIAYCEVWLDDAERSAELGRLVVLPLCRGRGFGQLLIERLASVASERGDGQTWCECFRRTGPRCGATSRRDSTERPPSRKRRSILLSVQ
ncbi:MAG: GNAT family N-acetyltransferase [Planctomycetes bacterium]|nr:GNAT family N-acetyltransferase [Planctomycetota bacterium]